MERVPSGAKGLDTVLEGGFPVNAINLVLGLPGSGKTLLAQQCVFANATVDQPAVYISTVSEPFEKIIRYGQELSFFDVDAVGERVFYEDVGATLLDGGLSAVVRQVTDVLNRHQPGLLVIDSFKPFSAFAESASEHRQFLHELAGQLSVRATSSIWVGEYSATEMPTAPEFAVADTVLWLTSARSHERDLRLLEVMKMRGSNFLSGKHAYRLSADGMRIFPRLADEAERDAYAFDDARIPSGLKPLDKLLGAGYLSGSATLVAGPSGAGKTVFGLQFIFEGAKNGAGSIFSTFEENPSQLARAASSFGWSFDDPSVTLMYRSAVDLYLDEWVHELLELIDSGTATRVFVDGLASLRAAASDATRFREYMYSLVQRCSRQGVSVVMSMETPELFGLTRLADVALSQIADNVILLQFTRASNEYKRALTILKARASETDPFVREYAIDSGGITVAPTPLARP